MRYGSSKISDLIVNERFIQDFIVWMADKATAIPSEVTVFGKTDGLEEKKNDDPGDDYGIVLRCIFAV